MKLDTYNFKARLAPVILVFLPATLAVSVWLPIDSNAWKMLGGLGVSTALSFLMVQLGRDNGYQKQAALFNLWGGPPTTRMLRHRDPTLDPHTKARYHQKLADLLPGLRIPSPRSENGNQPAADRVYESCAKFLREATRDKAKFALVFESNVAYGFRRNLWGMRLAGIASSTIGLISCMWNFLFLYSMNLNYAPASVVSTLVCGLVLTWWILRINPRWVKLAGDAYAERLLAACEILKPDLPPQSQPHPSAPSGSGKHRTPSS